MITIRSTLTTFALTSIFSFVTFSAPNITISGKVIDPYGKGLAEAKVKLIRNGTSVTTDSIGSFKFDATSAVYSTKKPYQGARPLFSKGVLSFRIDNSLQKVKIDLFNINGKHIETVFDKQMLPGTYTLQPLSNCKTAQLKVMRVVIGETVFIYSIPVSAFENIQKKWGDAVAAGLEHSLTAKSFAVFDTLQVSLNGYNSSKLPVDNPDGYYEITLTPVGTTAGRTDFYMYPGFQRIRVTLPPLNAIDFNNVINTNSYTFPVAFSSESINTLNVWCRNLVKQSPFKGFSNNEVPWIDISANQSARPYIFITQEQLAYLFVITIFNAGLTYQNNSELKTGLTFASKFNDGNPNFWLFSVMSFLTKMMQDETCKTTYVGCAIGGYSQEDGMAEITKNGIADRSMAPLNVCYFNESDILVQSPTRPLASQWCIAEKSTDSIGGSFHSVDIPGQCVVDIGGACYGGGTQCPGCHLAGSQDESLPVFYTETIGFSFFMPQHTYNAGLICAPLDIAFLGVRCYVDGINGNRNILERWCGNPMKPATDFLTKTITVKVDTQSIKMFDHSLVFVASQLNGVAPDFKNYYTKARKLCAVGNAGVGKYDFAGDCSRLTSVSNCTSPLMDIGKWYGAFTPNAYHKDISTVISGLFRRIGTFNWGAGVWWGDAQEYFMISWLGTSYLNNVVLDYYIFNSPCENSGVQCSMLTGAQCSDCYANSKYNNFSSVCSQTGVTGAVSKAKILTTGQFFDRLKAAARIDGFLFDNF